MDTVSDMSVFYIGVCLRKGPDRNFELTATNLTYTFLAITISEVG